MLRNFVYEKYIISPFQFDANRDTLGQFLNRLATATSLIIPAQEVRISA